MNLKKKLREFLSLARRRDGGFTLIELIVVIAIIAILGGVGVPAYSGYIDKTNKNADIALVGEVKHALTLAYYNNPANFRGGVVILSPDAYPEADGVEDAMEKTFGEGWQTNDALKLKHSGWNEALQNSGFSGDAETMTGLLATVDTLTNALSGALDFIEGGAEFDAYMDKLGATTNDEKSNAAVFYVANKTTQLTPEQMSTAIQSMGSTSDPQTALNNMNQTFKSDLSSAAALYALAEGYARYYDEKNPDATGDTPSTILANATNTISTNASNGQITDAIGAYTILFNAFGQMSSASDSCISDYFDNQMMNDFNAYADVLKTVSSAEQAIVDKVPLNTDSYFSSAEITDLVNKYAGGGVMVFAVVGDTIDVSSSIDNA